MADLVVTITENISLNGKAQGASTAKTITGVTDLYKRTITVPTTEVDLYTTATSSVSGSKFDEDLVKFVRITNLDSSNDIDLLIANTDSEETGVQLKAGKSFILWEHDLNMVAKDSALTVTSAVAGSADQAIADGDAANGMTEGQYVQVISSDSTTKNYVISDTNAGGAATGTVLTSSVDIGSNTFGNLVTAVSTGVAVGFNKSSATQNAFLVQLKAAVEHANGHNGKITIDSVPPQAHSSQDITFTQAVKGTAGNTTTTTDITNFTSADFTSGVNGIVTGKLSVNSISAIANTASCKVEIFVAST